MTYIKVFWEHTDEPILLYSELDEERWEIRKVYIFEKGRMEYASRTEANGETILSDQPCPNLSEITKSPEFVPLEIAKEEFEEIWRQALGG